MISIVQTTLLVITLIKCRYGINIPTVTLRNSALPNMTMPATGLGLGAYGADSSVGYGGYPECSSDQHGCGEYTQRAIFEWFEAGGRRLDSSNDYGNEKSVGYAMRESNLSRSDIFILSKVGKRDPMGYTEALHQFEKIKKDLQVDYVDLLLIHWPTVDLASTDPFCDFEGPKFNRKKCRLSMWRGMISIFDSGGAKAIGVSNFQISHLQEIIDAGLPLPSVNQCHFHPYGGSSQMDLVRFCKSHGIMFNGYSPLGVPDLHKFPGPDMATTPIKDPTIVSIAEAHGKSPAQVIMAWEWSLGIPINPRSQNAKHMSENLDIYDFTLTSEESEKIMALHQATCKEDPDFYQCFGPHMQFMKVKEIVALIIVLVCLLSIIVGCCCCRKRKVLVSVEPGIRNSSQPMLN